MCVMSGGECVVYAVGVDGGGTKTKAACLRNDGAVMGRSEAPASNYNSVGKEAAKSAGLSLSLSNSLTHNPSPMDTIFHLLGTISFFI